MEAYFVTFRLKFRSNFVPTSFQLRSNFVPSSFQLRPNFVPTSFQLRPNFVPTSFQLRSKPVILHLFNDKSVLDEKLFLSWGDLTDSSNLNRLLEKIQPDEVYNLAAQSHVKVSFEIPEYTAEVDAIGTLRILEAIRILNMTKTVKFYQASTSELYGLIKESPQTELTPFHPRSPYAVAKLYAYWI